MSNTTISYSFDDNKTINVTVSQPQADAGYHFVLLDWAFTWGAIKRDTITYLPWFASVRFAPTVSGGINDIVFCWMEQIREMLQNFEKAGSVSVEDIDTAVWLAGPIDPRLRQKPMYSPPAEDDSSSFYSLLTRGIEILMERAENDEQRDFLRNIHDMVVARFDLQ